MSRSYIVQNCTTSEPPPPPPPLPSTGGYEYGYGDGQESDQSSTPVDTNIRKIVYWCSNFTIGYRTTFINNFYEYLNEAYRSYYNDFIYKTLTGHSKITICLNPNQPGAFFSAINNSITFSDNFNIDYRQMRHEFFHAYQHRLYPNGIDQIQMSPYTGYSNIEFERAVFEDIVYGTNSPTAFHNSTDPVLKSEYEVWINGLRTNHPTQLSHLGGKYYYFLDKWKVLYTQYNKPTDYQLEPLALFNLFQNSNCP